MATGIWQKLGQAFFLTENFKKLWTFFIDTSCFPLVFFQKMCFRSLCHTGPDESNSLKMITWVLKFLMCFKKRKTIFSVSKKKVRNRHQLDVLLRKCHEKLLLKKCVFFLYKWLFCSWKDICAISKSAKPFNPWLGMSMSTRSMSYTEIYHHKNN